MISFLSFLNLVFFLRLLTTAISGELSSFYTPKETFFIDCGVSQDYKAADGRNWIGDNYSKFLLKENGGASTTSSAPVDSSNNTPLFATARLSHSEFTYRFPVLAGTKFIRLHFYQSSYGAFHRSKASFSVKTDGHTFLSNFNVSLAADALDSPIISKEFVINFKEDQMLNIVFNPSDRIGDAHAFINGIEIVSMPDDLYYSSPQDGGFQFIGQQNSFRIETDYALEMVYRLNVGGQYVSAKDDTGMFRTWDMDDDYCVKLAFVPANTSINLKFTKIPNYTAPLDVYRARTMGNSKTENMGYNLTWSLPVDSGFSYLLRLHFCEFQPEIQQQQDREFTIFIANQTAENHADVIKWSGGNGVPIYRDYGVMMPSQGSNKKQKLYIQLHPNLDYETVYNDAILNGIELFKLINPNPDQQPTSRESNKMKLVAITGGVVCGVVAGSVLCIFVVHQMKRKRDPGLRDRTLWRRPVFYIWGKYTDAHRSSLTSNLCRHFSLQDIKTATKNFDKGYIVGEGGFGNVYKGYINGGTTPVAMKRLNPESQQGAHEFMTEIEMLSQLRHIHLVSLVGYCNHKREMILVYEYMANGNLRDHLYNTDNPPLPWTQRLQICIGAARGLHYLHAGVKKTIIHRDVKTTNILLDHKWVAKVSDFGLSKMSPTSVANAHISTVVKGSFGYLDPEYFRFQRLNEKSDVYSFGVVLFEVLCARPPVNQTGEEEQAGLAHWAVTSYKNGKLEEIIDPHLKGKIAPMCLEKYGEIAVSCVLDQRIKRPSMSDVVRGLELALELQESTEKGNSINESLDHEEDLSQISGTDDDDKDVFHNGGRDVYDSEASRVTIPSNDEKSSISVMMEDDPCVV
ncbi:receptor-like protein kinase FERONIA [Vitis riparia]|uniref:receptor-like protein kinase FERONIA n=1 Tax=Vitis riparia TaxID=96939 RepID=UPI00155AE9A9|nr:receptor-like protein kinase FERONIA [Vitis riparia]